MTMTMTSEERIARSACAGINDMFHTDMGRSMFGKKATAKLTSADTIIVAWEDGNRVTLKVTS